MFFFTYLLFSVKSFHPERLSHIIAYLNEYLLLHRWTTFKATSIYYVKCQATVFLWIWVFFNSKYDGIIWNVIYNNCFRCWGAQMNSIHTSGILNKMLWRIMKLLFALLIECSERRTFYFLHEWHYHKYSVLSFNRAWQSTSSDWLIPLIHLMTKSYVENIFNEQ